jgi:general secretion pathway protein C
MGGIIEPEQGVLALELDGTDMTSPDKAIATLASLRTADHFTVVVNRAGQDMSLDYDVK